MQFLESRKLQFDQETINNVINLYNTREYTLTSLSNNLKINRPYLKQLISNAVEQGLISQETIDIVKNKGKEKPFKAMHAARKAAGYPATNAISQEIRNQIIEKFLTGLFNINQVALEFKLSHETVNFIFLDAVSKGLISEDLKEKIINLGYQARAKASSEAQLRKWQDEEHRERMRQLNVDRMKNPEVRNAAIENLKKGWIRKQD